MQYISDYRTNAVVSDMFFALARDSFGLALDRWAMRGMWDGRYTCHSLTDGGRMVANASTTAMTLLINGEEHRALQIGTVCTRPEYRMRGCARELLERIIASADGAPLFLFANDSARGLYGKLGFAPAPRECVPHMTLDSAEDAYAFRPATVAEAYRAAATNAVYSPTFDVRTNACLAELYMHDFYPDALHICDDTGVCAVWDKEGDVLHVRALYGAQPCDPVRLAAAFARTGAQRAEFDFMPDGWGLPFATAPSGPDETFVMNIALPAGIAYPGLMRA